MPKNTYTAQFKVDTVKLCESHPELGYSQTAKDLGPSEPAPPRGPYPTVQRQRSKAYRAAEC